jgi:uncharacterized protein YjbJ (UPF0337 family)
MLFCNMKRSTKNQIKGGARELKGDLKQRAGRALDKGDWQAEGAVERTVGKAQKKMGEIEEELEEDLEDNENR